ncbi:MAG: M1 family metallopeptidase [Ignavibacteriae bacterium]|nr:M1 family metallopeptidase [Ignavibacteriota bacterium]
MNKTLLFWVLVLIFNFPLFSQNPLFKPPLSERIANYNISIELDTADHSLRGNEILIWKNTSSDEINELQFHLYLNAFKGDSTTFMIESGSRVRGVSTKDKEWGWIDIHSMKIVNGENLTDKIEYFQPDDNNKNDKTVIRVPLAKPVLPNEKIEVKIEFTSKLPNIFARTGYEKDFYLVGQWFPKIGVYEKAGQRNAENGRWNCHQFHANSEFYADFGVYNVEIILPKDFIVGATGQLQYEKVNEDGSKYLLYHAEDVIDFAWTASPEYLTVEKIWEHVQIKALIQPSHFYLADRILESAVKGLSYMDANVGKYPYPYLTIVDPPFYAVNAGGMEYPTFITTLSFWGFPENIKITESTTIHEFVHNYFMGMVASNEFEEPWLDEGFTQYYEARIMDENYGEKTSLLNILDYHIGDFEITRGGYTGMKYPEASDNTPFAWEYPLRTYGVMSYYKPATMLKTLENIIGRQTFDNVIKTYFEKWKFKHPGGKDFIKVVNEVVLKEHGNRFGENMDWYFDQVIYGSGICDYKIDHIKIDEVKKSKPNLEKDNNEDENYESNILFKSEVVVYRNGDVKIPVEILIHFDNGNEILEIWDGKDRFHNYMYTRPEKVVWAKVDPESKIALDLNIENNSVTTKKETTVLNKYAAKVLFWLENVMLTFSMIF